MPPAYSPTPTATSHPITDYPLLILVGLTGVGKSTTVAAMEADGLQFALLPNRRTLTDDLIISYLQRQNGETVTKIRDRAARFDFTRRYRRQFPGGMAHVLSRLHIEPAALNNNLLLFDGLRGANEVTHAATLLPNAQFLVLTAPDFVRIQRLLGRNDEFDNISNPAAATANLQLEPTVEASLSPTEKALITDWIMRGDVTLDDVNAKCQIVVKERSNYNSDATLAALHAHAPRRTIHAQTELNLPAQIAKLVKAHLKE